MQLSRCWKLLQIPQHCALQHILLSVLHKYHITLKSIHFDKPQHLNALWPNFGSTVTVGCSQTSAVLLSYLTTYSKVWGLKKLPLTHIPQRKTGEILEASKNQQPDYSWLFSIHRYLHSWQSRNNPAPPLLLVQHITAVLTISIAILWEKAAMYLGVRKVTATFQRYRRGRMRRKFISLVSEASLGDPQPWAPSSIRTKLLCTCPIPTSKQWHNFHMKGQFSPVGLISVNLAENKLENLAYTLCPTSLKQGCHLKCKIYLELNKVVTVWQKHFASLNSQEKSLFQLIPELA